GTGQTRDEAESLARDRAVGSLLAKQDPPFEWQGAEAFVREHAKDASRPVIQAIDPPIGTEHYKATVTLGLSTADYQELLEKDRSTRAAVRHSSLLPGFAVVVCLLGAAGIYHRVTRRNRVQSV